MTELEFNDCIDEIFDQIEDSADELDVDIDCERSGGVLTLTCENGSSIILSRQVASRELWVAAKSGGFHFHYEDDNERWFSVRDQEDFVSCLARVTTEQAGLAITLPGTASPN